MICRKLLGYEFVCGLVFYARVENRYLPGEDKRMTIIQSAGFVPEMINAFIQFDLEISFPCLVKN